jgi:ribosomal protein L35
VLFRSHAFTRHILTSKAPGRKRKLRQSVVVSDADHAKLMQMLPN